MRSLPFVITCTLICGWLLSACQPASDTPPLTALATQPSQPVSDCVLRAGFDAWEPYHYLGQGQQPQGLDIEILQALASELGCRLTLQQDTWTALLSNLQQGELDILPGASRSAEREAYAWFSEPYRQEQFVLYQHREQPLNAADLEPLLQQGHKVGLVSGYYYGAEVDQLLGAYPAQFVSAQLSELNMARLLDEEISGLLEDRMVATAILRRKGLDRYITASEVQLPPSSVFLMLSKQSISAQQVAEIDAALQRLQQQGKLAALLAQYQQ